ARCRDRSRGPRTRSRDRTAAAAMALGNSVGIGHTCAIADEPASLPFMAVAGRLVLQELCKQLSHFPRLLLLHPMAGAVHQMKADHAGARGFLHTLGGAWGLVDAPVAFAPDEHGWDVDSATCERVHLCNALGVRGAPHPITLKRAG